MNPLVLEAWRGLSSFNAFHKAWLSYMFLQACALAVWWPDADITDRLEMHDAPEPLLAVLIALGVSVAYLSLRLGAEEILLEGQFSLREWVTSEVGIGRLAAGSVLAHLLSAGYLVLMSSPLLLVSYTVGGGTVPLMGTLLGATLLMALFFRLIGATLYFAMGHLGSETFVLLRLVFVIVYLPVALAVESLSHFMLCYHAMNAAPLYPDFGVPPMALFVAVYGLGSAALVSVLCRQMAGYRRRMAQGH